jgi:hypothetical protein
LQEHPELLGIYLPGSSTLLAALLGCSKAAADRCQLQQAEDLARQAVQLLPLMRHLPDEAAQAALQLATVLRHRAMHGPAGG